MEKFEKIITIFIFITLILSSIYVLLSGNFMKKQQETINQLRFEKEYLDFVIDDYYKQMEGR